MRKILLMVLGVAVASSVVLADNEILMTGILRVKNGLFELQRNISNKQFNQRGQTASYIIQSFPSGTLTRVSIASEVTTNGVYWMNNLSTNPTHYIDIGVTNGAEFLPLMRIRAGEFAAGRLYPTNYIWAQAVGTFNLETWVNQD